MKVKWILIFMLIVIFATLYFSRNVVKLPEVQNGIAVFCYGDSDMRTALSDIELTEISEIFNGKIMFSDMPSCGFTENISIQINDKTQVFCFACDGHNLVYWENKNKYFKLSTVELAQIHALLALHGFAFPCV